MRRLSLIISAFLLSGTMSLTTQAQVTGVSVSDGGESIIFNLEERPEVTFTSTDLVITTSDRRVEYPVTSGVTFEFIDLSGLADNHLPMPLFTISASKVMAEGLTPEEPVLVFTCSGTLLLSSHADNAGEWSASTDILPMEPVIIKTRNHSYKIIIRK